MVFHSELSKTEYLAAMKDNMSSHFAFGFERFTGFFIGNFFYITYHSGYEWNQKITNQKNTAVGFVKNAPAGENGCDIHFFQFKGMLCPLVFLPTFLALLGFLWIALLPTGDMTGELFLTGFIVALATMVLVAPIHTLIESTTDGSIEGEKALLLCLANPKDPYGSIDYFP